MTRVRSWEWALLSHQQSLEMKPSLIQEALDRKRRSSHSWWEREEKLERVTPQGGAFTSCQSSF